MGPSAAASLDKRHREPYDLVDTSLVQGEEDGDGSGSVSENEGGRHSKEYNWMVAALGGTHGDIVYSHPPPLTAGVVMSLVACWDMPN